MCDGIVTFNACKGKESRRRRVSIMIQAKDYHGNSRLDTTKLNKHAKTMNNKVLDGVFGSPRLLCVASGHESSTETKTDVMPRDYFPFEFNQGELLSHLLVSLQSQRSQFYQFEKYSCLCDEDGEVVSTGKRKR